MSHTITLTVPGDISYTRVASSSASQAAELFLLSIDKLEKKTEFCHAFELAISEAFANAVNNANDLTEQQPITIQFIRKGSTLTATVSDRNKPFSIETPMPDISTYPENGFGLMLIRNVMDCVSYSRKDNTNTIRMSKTAS
ncbi:MAG: ATP-binding protein [Prosthecochloris sp.]|uniref:ATP-binding protein n=1 Tax=Prosthecochloris sp. TaxID=290513 RepID=UPI0025858DA0|nr:ATP-binding protein [Prosthecochloris sp.]MCW8798453.1 ATP-binding protein [Prosthecochloris sp.]